ncbi:EAL domain-containing protein [Ruminococcus albus]|uniref:EAL domain, c-di-GMP-specific phosphodiesterase class I (Or its enzymatically inactive variant) n=1 Tax=Ruminococcus albus TaxID=1264 RepID=A0A1H7L4Z2_RUMAL|nr:EAL domain-containing protein [Ruminococcus albus]SEK93894.1 EAL domain, c-di-GMP-specific phosphodiesterase class I (or its enzymatically inactive variant) [Ruminococcus albus]
MLTDIVEAFQYFIKRMSELKNPLETESIADAIKDICRLSNVGLMKVDVYSSVTLVGTDDKKTHILCNSGETDDDFIRIKKITGGYGALIYTIHHKKGTEPWTDRVHNRLDLMVSILYMFTSSFVVNQVAKKYAFNDEDGYHNLRYFGTQLIKLAVENQLKGLAAAQFNLKHFQGVNHQVGRENGDAVMRGFIDGLEKIKDHPLPVCRMGGDNFIMLMSAKKVDDVIGYLKGTIISFGNGFSERINVSATAGIFVFDDDFDLRSLDDVMDKVMPASSLAKTAGRDDVIFYDSELMKIRQRIASIQHLLPISIEKEEFKVYYQPKVSITDGTIVGAEALCRWARDDGLIHPIEFIPILEQSMDICKLDFYMIEHVCRDIRRWLDEGKNVVRISVNLSRKHMLDVDLVQHLLDFVDKYDVPHDLFEIELTETTTDVEFKDLKRVVSGLQKQGISTSVDDFGIGYSSLKLIKEIPWNVLKIDKSIVPADEDDEHSPTSVMFKYVVAMAREMGLAIIAEGVETVNQVEVLRKNGCDIAQGFYYDKPLPVEVFEKRLETGVIIK